jgi:methyl-accepting chemotaxis protein
MATPTQLLETCISQHLADPSLLEKARAKCAELLPPEIIGLVNTVLQASATSYRDGILIQLAYRDSITDYRIRPDGARHVASKLGSFLAKNHIKAVKDAYQNIAKNTEQLVRGNNKEFDEFLTWASQETTTAAALDALFDPVAAISESARKANHQLSKFKGMNP